MTENHEPELFVLKKVKQNLNNNQLPSVYFLEKDKIIIGRDPRSDIVIDCNTVSSFHAILIRSTAGWCVKDVQSVNGVFINKNKLIPNKVYKLVINDIVTLAPNHATTYSFILETLGTRKTTDINSNNQSADLSKENVLMKAKVFQLEEQLRESKEAIGSVDKNEYATDEFTNEVLKLSEDLDAEKIKNKDLEQAKYDIEKQLEEVSATLKKNQNDLKFKTENEVALLEKIGSLDLLVVKLSTQNKETAKNEKNLLSDLSKACSEVVSLKKKVSDLETTVKTSKTDCDNLDKIRKNLESEVKKLTKELQASNDKFKTFMAEKDRAEKDFQALTTQLKLQLSQKVQKPISINADGDALKDMQNHVGQLMEAELNCSICSELFISTVTLGCSHSFCCFCITSWKRNKKDCPICRKDITTEANSPVIDNFINKMMGYLPPDMKRIRDQLVQERCGTRTPIVAVRKLAAATNVNRPRPANVNQQNRRPPTRPSQGFRFDTAANGTFEPTYTYSRAPTRRYNEQEWPTLGGGRNPRPTNRYDSLDSY